jgi:hypothetical protein
MSDVSSAAPTGGAPSATTGRVDGTVRRASYLVAAGGLLTILELPFVGPLVRLVAIGLVVAGVLRLRQVVVAPRGRRWLDAAGLLALAVAAITLVLVAAELTVLTGGTPPPWLRWVGVAKMALGIVGTVALASGMACDMRDHADQAAEDGWWHAATAVVLIQAPILVAAVATEVTGRPDGVHGAAAIALFATAILPYLLVARAGHLSDPAADTAGHRGRGADAPVSTTSRPGRAGLTTREERR